MHMHMLAHVHIVHVTTLSGVYVHVTTLSGVRGTGGVVPVLWYVYKEIDSLIQQRQFFSRGGRSAPCAPVATLEQTL